MISTIGTALRLIDRSTRRRIVASVPAALLVALVEGSALAVLLPVLEVVADDAVDPATGPLRWLADLTGVTDPSRLQVVAILVVFGLLLAKSLLGAGLRWWQLGFLARGEERLAVELFGRYVDAPYQFHVGRNSAESVRDAESSVNAVVRSVLVPATRILADGTQLLVTVAVIMRADWLTGLAAGVYFGLVGAVYVAIVGPKMRRLGQRGHHLNGTTLQRMQECIVGVKTIQAAGAEARMLARFDRERRILRDVRHRVSFVNFLPRLYLEIALVGGGILVVVLVAGQGSRAETVTTLGLLLAAAFRALPSVGQMLASADSIRAGRAAVDQVAGDFRRVEAAPGSGPVGASPIGLDRSLEIAGVGFTYPDGRVALAGLSFEVPRGQSVGIMGPSGAGKTTLVDLLMGFMAPTTGRIVIDGVPLGPDRIAGWRERVGYIPQDVFISDDTLARNVALGLRDAEIDPVRLRQAVEAAALGDLVAGLPDGINSPVGERGSLLSGGQRQRIGIARALYRQPDVLILDEATSALDNITESAITDLLTRLKRELTLITIAHRPSTIAGCDRVIVLDDGRLAADGPPGEILPALSSVSNGR